MILSPDLRSSYAPPLHAAREGLFTLAYGLVIGLLLCATAPAFAVEGAANIAEEGLLADDPSQARAAFDSQAADPAHHRHLRAILHRLETRLEATAANDRQALATAVATPLSASALEPLGAAHRNLDAAARALLRYAFDDKQYPVPAKAHTGWVPGVDVQPGQEQFEKLYAECFDRYSALEALQHARLLALIAALEPGADKPFADDLQPDLPTELEKLEQHRKNATGIATQPGRLPDILPLTMYPLRAPDRSAERLLQLLRIRAERLRRIARKLDDLRDWQDELDAAQRAANQADRQAVARAAGRTDLPADDTRAPADPFAGLAPAAQALLALSEDRYAVAATQAAKISTPAQFSLFWRDLCGLAALVHNNAAPDLRETERWHLREINLYRLSLGLRPLIHNDRLQTAAQKHGERMRDKKFFGHFDPDDDRKTPQLRAQREGYRGLTGENITGGQDGWRCLWRWRSDAGHHRVLILPAFCEAGLAEVAGFETLDTGGTATQPIQQLFDHSVSSSETTGAKIAEQAPLTILP